MQLVTNLDNADDIRASIAFLNSTRLRLKRLANGPRAMTWRTSVSSSASVW